MFVLGVALELITMTFYFMNRMGWIQFNLEMHSQFVAILYLLCTMEAYKL